MSYLWTVWLKPRIQLTPLDELVVGLEVVLACVAICAAWELAGWAWRRWV